MRKFILLRVFLFSLFCQILYAQPSRTLADALEEAHKWVWVVGVSIPTVAEKIKKN
jgi:hypothetical protein